jgi:hypothetical protein
MVLFLGVIFFALLLSMSILLFFSLLISLFSGMFILYNLIKRPNRNIKIDGNIKINLTCHICYLISLIICPILLIKEDILIGFVIYYCINIFLTILIYKLVKIEILNIKEIICFLIFPAIITFKKNRITKFLRPFSNKEINILLLIFIMGTSKNRLQI